MMSTRSFRWAVHALVVAAGLATIVLQAQTPAGQPPANPPLFTGTSTVMDGKDLSAARRRFEPGARTYWHSHDNGQLLYVEAGGCGRRSAGRRSAISGPAKATTPAPASCTGTAPRRSRN